MRSLAVHVCLVVLAFSASGCGLFGYGGQVAGKVAQPTKVKIVQFEDQPVGKAPAGFTEGLTGEGSPPTWAVVESLGSPGGTQALAQLSEDPTSYRFPFCVYDSIWAKDVNVSVQFKCISGKVDRAAGIVFRYRDRNNYYVARANALENNVRLYRVVDGRRTEIASRSAKVSSGEWHTLSIRAAGREIRVTMDDASLETKDETFPGPGLAGVWTKADSVTHFGNLKIESYDPK